MGFFTRRRAASPRVGPSPEELERLKTEHAEQPPANISGTLDSVGKKHVIQSTSHCGVGVMLVGVWYAALRQRDYLGAENFWRDEYVVAAHTWVLSAIVAYIHKRQSGQR